MTFSLRFLPSALVDLENAHRFYETIQTGLGNYCTDSLLTDIESLQFYGGIHPKTGQHHRLLSKRFPFAIYYKVQQQTIVITAVLSTRQNPNNHLNRVNH